MIENSRNGMTKLEISLLLTLKKWLISKVKIKKQRDSLVNIYNKGLRLGKFRDIKEFRTYLKERGIVHKFRIIKTHLDNFVKYRNNILEVRARSAKGGRKCRTTQRIF